MQKVIHHLRRAVLLRNGGGLCDEQLLESFLARRDECAFFLVPELCSGTHFAKLCFA